MTKYWYADVRYHKQVVAIIFGGTIDATTDLCNRLIKYNLITEYDVRISLQPEREMRATRSIRLDAGYILTDALKEREREVN